MNVMHKQARMLTAARESQASDEALQHKKQELLRLSREWLAKNKHWSVPEPFCDVFKKQVWFEPRLVSTSAMTKLINYPAERAARGSGKKKEVKGDAGMSRQERGRLGADARDANRAKREAEQVAAYQEQTKGAMSKWLKCEPTTTPVVIQKGTTLASEANATRKPAKQPRISLFFQPAPANPAASAGTQSRASESFAEDATDGLDASITLQEDENEPIDAASDPDVDVIETTTEGPSSSRKRSRSVRACKPPCMRKQGERGPDKKKRKARVVSADTTTQKHARERRKFALLTEELAPLYTLVFDCCLCKGAYSKGLRKASLYPHQKSCFEKTSELLSNLECLGFNNKLPPKFARRMLEEGEY